MNGNRYGMAYYLTDGIYPKWATFIHSITEPQTPKARLFAQHQETARKDVENDVIHSNTWQIRMMLRSINTFILKR